MPTMPTSTQIRQQFIDFFVAKCGHTYVPSSLVVPHDDPTLLFTNAGMNQFKDVFLGLGKRPYTRAVNTQKCIRAGGKHNDLDDVGKDTYHHTFFEMLGNWSFGDYFKKESIDWAWELLVKVWGMDPSRLHATYFEGNPTQGLEPDLEARKLWLQYLPPERVHPGNMKDNFWEMGDSGPCGPCSEIHVDLTPGKTGGHLVNKGDASVMEIWNLVFIQFNRDAAGKLSALPARHVDTGMGFERICSVLQGKSSNYDTDVFTPIFDAIRKITSAPAYGGSLTAPIDIAYRVIADHARTLTFALTDGAVPSNEGRGYVLRRILRRAVRYGRQNLAATQPFLHLLVETVVRHMGDFFPELKKNPERVAELIRTEEESFIRTLDRGIELFNQAASRDGRSISADDAFRLYDTYGFPLDLTVLMAEERAMKVDKDGFEELMEQARQRSRATGGAADALASLQTIVQNSTFPATEFEGYITTRLEKATLLQAYALDGQGEFKPVDRLEAGRQAALVADATPFYAESGGQVGDSGVIHLPGGQFRVSDTKKIGSVIFHLGQLESGRTDCPAGLKIRMAVDEARRTHIAIHHTATHVMNHKLRDILGEHVQQKGSLVDEHRLRFDFSHDHPVTPEELGQVELLVNEDVEEDMPVYTRMVPQEDAMEIHGLRAVFGEKYPPIVRVVSIGPDVDSLLEDPDDEEWRDFSVEFCGGTHLDSTGPIKRFIVASEEGVAKGVRRITALAGDQAALAMKTAAALNAELDQLARQPAEKLESAVASFADGLARQTLGLADRAGLRDRLAGLQNIIKEHRRQAEKQAAGDIVQAARQVAESASGAVVIHEFPGATPDSLRTAMDVIRSKCPDAAMLLASAAEDKVFFLASVPQPLIDKGLKAGDWVREVAKAAGGSGGGRPDMAQAGGKDPAKLPDALNTARQFAQSKLG